MKKVTALISLMLFILNTLPTYAQNYGTHIPVDIDESARRFFSQTDWSPDGKWIAFRTENDIYVYNIETGQTGNITDEIEEQCMFPCFTPDSQEITFTILNYARNFESPTWDHIVGINLYTGEQRIIMDAAFEGSWSSDGDYFIYSYWPRDGTDYKYAVYDYDSDETIYYNFGPEPPVFSAYSTNISPDNSHFIASLKAHNERKHPVYLLYSVDLDSGEAIQLNMGAGDIYFAEYSPDGKWITFSGQLYTYSGEFLYDNAGVYNTETEEVFELVPDSEYEVHSSCWSPDGTQICYVLETDTGNELYIKDFDLESEEIQTEIKGTTPIDFSLLRNYPNPFNPSTIIEFSIPESGFIDLIIYNVIGQKVRNLVSGQLNQGVNSVIWDGCDDRGLPVSAGIYVTQLRMGNAVATGRMLLVK